MNTNKSGRNQGFTLIELMVVVAIIAITMGIGLPSYNSVMASNRLTTSANDMVVALQVARSEAIKKMKFAGVSINTDVVSGSSVTTDTKWIAFLNSSTITPNASSPGTLIQRYAAANGITVSSTNDTPKYRPDGRLTSTADIVVTFTVSGNAEKRILTIKPSGRMSVVTA